MKSKANPHVGGDQRTNAVLSEGESRETVSAPAFEGSNDPLAQSGVFISEANVSKLVRDNRLKHGEVPVDLLKSDLSTYAKLLWAVLDSFGEVPFPNLKSISQRLGASKPTVIKAQRELEAAGWIVVQNRQKQEKSNLYELTHPGMEREGYPCKPALPPLSTSEPTLVNDVDLIRIKPLTLNTYPKKTSVRPFQDALLNAIRTKNPAERWPRFSWLIGVIREFMETTSLETWTTWAENYVNDPFVKTWTVAGFLKDPAKFTQARKDFTREGMAEKEAEARKAREAKRLLERQRRLIDGPDTGA